MAAATGIITAVAGLAITVYQMDQANQAGKEADIAESQAKQEIAKVMQYLTEKYVGQNVPLDQLIRSALGYLSENIQT